MQPHDAAAQGGLAAAGLTDHAQGLAPVHLQIDMGEGVEELGAASGLPTGLLLGTLMKLELTGRVYKQPGQRYVLR